VLIVGFPREHAEGGKQGSQQSVLSVIAKRE
jgi:hypothetical protein